MSRLSRLFRSTVAPITSPGVSPRENEMAAAARVADATGLIADQAVELETRRVARQALRTLSRLREIKEGAQR